MKTAIIALFVLSMLQSSAQEIAGRILDDRREPLINANVQAFQNGILKDSNVTDFDGNYVIKPVDSGLCDVKIFYTGFDTVLVTNVVVTPGNRTTQNCGLSKGNGVPKCVKIAYKRPLVYRDWPEQILVKDEMDVQAYRSYLRDYAGPTNLGGARRDTGTIYIIDGIAVRIKDSVGIDMINDGYPMTEVSDGSTFTLTKEQIDHIPATTIDDLMTIFPGIYQQRRGDPISIHGLSGTVYYIDGVRQ